METNFTRSGFLARLFTVLFISTISITFSYAQSCACKESVQVSLDEDGEATVTASMLLADNSTCAGTQTVTVMLTPTGNPIAGSPDVNCSHAGKTLYGKVSNGTNSCWSKLVIEDKIKPVITCPTGVLALSCAQMSTYVPVVSDNCAVAKLDTISETITVNNCSNFPANVLKRIVRTYQATDIFNNKSLPCTITIDVMRIPSLASIAMPLNYTVATATELACKGPWAALPNGNPSPLDVKNAEGVVVLPGTGVPSLDGLKLYPDPDLYCNLMVSYSDTNLPNIGCVTKIMRTWTVIEWSCDNRTRTPHVQIIEVKDSQGPVFAPLSDVKASTSNHTCEGVVTFANAVLSDNCAATADLTLDITVYPNGNLSVPGVFIKHGASKTVQLPVGTHVAVYTAYDACYNKSTASIVVEVEDNTPPVAICDEFATIGLTSDGSAWVPATVFDDGSYDECSLAKLLVRRMNNTNCAPCETPEFPGFTLLGEYGTGANKHYYYLSQHAAMAPVAYKTAKAMGGYVVSYESLAEANWVAEKAYENLPDDYNRLLIGLSDRDKEGSFKWESGATTTYTMPWANTEPDGSGDYVVQRRNLKWRDIGNEEAFVKYVVEITDPCGWSAAAQFCCADIGSNKMVGLRAIDASGNFNDCMVSAIIQDKIGPVITCPADMTVACDFAYDPKNLRKDFGWPVATDNCENPRLTQDSVITINACRVGTIKRTFTVTDAGGRTASCVQTITFEPSIDQVYEGPSEDQWPADATVNGCGNPNAATLLPAALGSPILTDGACSLVGAQYEDQVFSFNNPTSPACFKILRTWTVIDWCHPLTGGGYQTWKYVQEIKVIDNVAPVFATLAPSVSADTYDAACASGTISLTASATDVCTTVLKNSYKIDLGNDGTFLSEVSGTGNSINASGSYPVGKHKIVYTFEDKCGNLTSKEQLFSIINRKAPNAYVKQGLAISLMKIGENEGMAEIWASDFDNGSSHPCGYPVLLSFTPVSVNAAGQMVGTPNAVYDCDNLGQEDVTIYVAALTPAGDVVQSSVTTFIDVQDNNDICQGNKLSVKGAIATENNDLLEEAHVSLLGSEFTAMTGANGAFAFSNMTAGGQYVVTPEKNDDHINGISTLDLVMIQRHILGMDKLNTPYKQIAADVTKDGKISAADLVELRKLVLGTTTSFTNNKSWRFVDKSYSFHDVNFAQGEAFPEVYNIDNLNTDMISDFVAVKVGDVNGNAKANVHSDIVEPRSNNKFVLTTDNATFENGQKIVVPVRTADISQLTGIQFTLDFDSELMSLVSIDPVSINVNDSNFGFANVHNGTLTASWNDAAGISLAGNETLFTVTFTAKDHGTIAEAIRLNSSVTKAEAYDAEANVAEIAWKVTERTNQSEFVLHQNTPNPFNVNTIIGFELPESMPVTMSIYDVTGKVVRTFNISGAKGYNTLEINKSEVNTGVMYYVLKGGEFTATRKMVVIE